MPTGRHLSRLVKLLKTLNWTDLMERQAPSSMPSYPPSGGLVRVGPITFGPNGNLFAGNMSATGQMLRYNGTTGAFMDVFIPPRSGGLLPAMARGHQN